MFVTKKLQKNHDFSACYSVLPLNPGGNISQNFSELNFEFLIFQFSEKFWDIFQISSESYRFSPKITEYIIQYSKKSGETSYFSQILKKVSHFLQISRISSEPGETEKIKILEKSQKL